ncbi:hypothetical protein CDAR_458881 [Caerostris darwini]|uniref:Uncharacterized protein n=1 Tax=Caerostris darwini TaxID=1538125 RepID=A0AAV4MQB3_9ARAC|nr:hypothetical protein CDAR_458881 [Caerostris darwini]
MIPYVLETDEFSDYEDNINDKEVDNDVENNYADLIDNDMEESDEILIDEEMNSIRSRNRKRVRVIISSCKDELPQQIPFRRKKAKLNNDMWFNKQSSTEFST